MISIVIPAFNGQETISETLKALSAQSTGESYEVIVVDDGSTDKTAEIVQSFPDVIYVYQKNRGPAAARNLGFQKARGEIVFFTDADCIPSCHWIQRSLKHIRQDDHAVVAGSYGFCGGGNILSRSIQNEIIYRHVKFMPIYPKSFGSYNFCVKRNIFAEVEGFNEQYPRASGEDNDLSYKIYKKGYKIFFAIESVVIHRHEQNLWKYLRDQFRHGFYRVRMYWDFPHMVRGDDYTFWKDIAEPPLIYAMIVFGFLSTFRLQSTVLFGVVLFSLIFLLMAEVYYSLVINSRWVDQLGFFVVLTLRALARSIGFLVGIIAFSLQIIFRFPKKN